MFEESEKYISEENANLDTFLWYNPLLPFCSGSDPKLHLMVRLQFWSFGECGAPLY